MRSFIDLIDAAKALGLQWLKVGLVCYFAVFVVWSVTAMVSDSTRGITDLSQRSTVRKFERYAFADFLEYHYIQPEFPVVPVGTEIKFCSSNTIKPLAEKYAATLTWKEQVLCDLSPDDESLHYTQSRRVQESTRDLRTLYAKRVANGQITTTGRPCFASNNPHTSLPLVYLVPGVCLLESDACIEGPYGARVCQTLQSAPVEIRQRLTSW